MRTYKHKNTEYEVQFYNDDIVLESPKQDLVFKGGYSDLRQEAIQATSFIYTEEGYEYDGDDVDQFIDQNYEWFIEKNISNFKVEKD